MPRRLASGYASSPLSLLLSGQCPDMSYSGGFSPGVPPLPIPNREVKPGRADGTAPQCGRVGRRLLSGEPSRKRGGSAFLPLFLVQGVGSCVIRRGRNLELGQVRCCRTPRVRQSGDDGCGRAETTGVDIKMRRVDVPHTEKEDIAAICFGVLMPFFSFLWLVTKECLFPFWRCAI